MKGQQFLSSEFGVRPSIGWIKGSIDHSEGHARLLADLGIHTLILSKMSQAEMDRRSADHSLDFIWRPFNNHFGHKKQIMVSSMQDDLCQFTDAAPFIADPTLKTFNAEFKSQALINRIEKMIKSRKSSNILLSIGCTG